MFLIVGLGNPEKKYDNTYHNVGFRAIDFLAESFGFVFAKSECKAITASIKIGSETVIFAKPQTYMNLSGESVVMLKNKYKIENKNILIMLDDIDLDVGKLRYRKSGSGGTHNGLKNIVQLLGSADVQRIRFGIGNDKKMDLADYVLSKINDENSTKIDAAIFESKDVLLKEFFDAK